VAQELVQLIHGKHRGISRDRFGGSGRSLRASNRVRESLERDPGFKRFLTKSDPVVSPPIGPEDQRAIRALVRNQASNRALDAPDVRPADGRLLGGLLDPIGPTSASPVRRRIDVVHEPRFRPDRGPNPQGLVLPADERLEVIVDDRLGYGRKLGRYVSIEEDRVPSEALGHAGDGGLGAMRRAGELPVSRARRQSRGHEDEELGTLQVVGG
jgi:hypothetical protein